MKTATSSILTINGGSSSIRWAVYDGNRAQRRILGDAISLADHHDPVTHLLGIVESQSVFESVRAIGHRVVFGMKHSRPERITPRLIAELRRITPYVPEHLPIEIALIEALRRRHPRLSQFACFDTAFHCAMPRIAKLLPIPRRYAKKGVERHGFHGLSYEYLMEELTRLDPAAARGRVVLAHLGSGASVAAVRDGKSIDTSMGLTPASGLVMSTRAGDLDPGLAYYLSRTEGMTLPRFQRMVNHESGLLGISGTSADIRELLAREATDERAADAIGVFCYQVKKWIGAYAAALGGVDAVVFAGGIGEHAPLVRARICEGLDFLGIRLDKTRNSRNAAVISTARARVTVRVIHTDEELMIARSVARALAARPSRTGKDTQ